MTKYESSTLVPSHELDVGHLPLLPLAVERKGSLHADTEHQDVFFALVVFTEKAITRLRIIIRGSHVVEWVSRIRRVPQRCCGYVYRPECCLWSKVRDGNATCLSASDEEIVVVARQAEARRQELGRTKKSKEANPEQKHLGEGAQEREDTDRVKSVASACQSLGRCPPVLGMVALRGVRENVGRNKDTHEELAEQIHKGDGPQEREDTVCRPGSPVLGTAPIRPEVSPRGVKSHLTHGIHIKSLKAVHVPALGLHKEWRLRHSPKVVPGSSMDRKLYREHGTASDVRLKKGTTRRRSHRHVPSAPRWELGAFS